MTDASPPTARSSPRSCPRPISASGAAMRGRTASSCITPACRPPRARWRCCAIRRRGLGALFRLGGRRDRPARPRGQARLARRRRRLERRERSQFGFDRRRDRQSRPRRRPAAVSRAGRSRRRSRSVATSPRGARFGPSACSPIPTSRPRASAIPASDFPGTFWRAPASAIGSRRRRSRRRRCSARPGRAAGARAASDAGALRLRSRDDRRLRRADPSRRRRFPAPFPARRGSTARPTRRRSRRCAR